MNIAIPGLISQEFVNGARTSQRIRNRCPSRKINRLSQFRQAAGSITQLDARPQIDWRRITYRVKESESCEEIYAFQSVTVTEPSEKAKTAECDSRMEQLRLDAVTD
jgi:hypothetical protein